ncbi:MAG: hypothetical protein K0R48_1304 [Gammaproteobacteria bacterium]|jgi:hypothetical protein|nr:hypothetical protein [Gammaproteobacteria bacterium]
MKKFLLSILFLSITLGLNAAETAQPPATKKEDSIKINLYAEDNDKKVIDTLPPTARLIKIYQKGNWIKVGNPKDGTVGWINEKQYQEMLAQLNQFTVQEIFISRMADGNSHPKNKLIVYQNGKPVSEKEANEIYKNLKKQLEEQQKYWDKFKQDMIASQNQMLEGFYENPFFTHPEWIPIPVVVIEKSGSAKDKMSDNKDKDTQAAASPR